jgi:outer membrane receptor protein involved in Fe transport
MILNIGMRFDYFNPKTVVPSSVSDPLLQEYALDPSNIETIFDLEERLKGAAPADIKKQLSPRIGISYPITEQDVLHVTYGHYFQLPMFDFFYNNHGYDLRGAFKYIGNPDLEVEKTIAYEAGLEHGFNDYLKLSVTGFYKDISNLTSYTKMEFGAGVLYLRTNRDFARVKGFELALSQRPWNNISGVITYTYQIARGRASDEYQTFLDDYRNRKPRTEDYPLDSDQRHTARANLNYQIPGKWGPAFGDYHPFGDWGVDLFWTYGSGTPYTAATNVPQPAIPDINGENLPYTWRLDLRIDKGFSLYKTLKADFFVEIRNVTDRADIEDVYDVERYDLYGEPGGQFGNPGVYSTPRRILLGMEVTF